MSVRVLIPTPLRPFTNQQAAVPVDGATVGDLLRALTDLHADLRPHLYSPDGTLRTFVNVYVNDRDIRQLQRDRTPVHASDTVSIVPSVAGGSGAAATLGSTLTHDEIQRYSRHLIIPEVGVAGQERLKQARVVCIGAGGLGSLGCLSISRPLVWARSGSWTSTSWTRAICSDR